jgi:hypothetical protein
LISERTKLGLSTVRAIADRDRSNRMARKQPGEYLLGGTLGAGALHQIEDSMLD